MDVWFCVSELLQELLGVELSVLSFCVREVEDMHNSGSCGEQCSMWPKEEEVLKMADFLRKGFASW